MTSVNVQSAWLVPGFSVRRSTNWATPLLVDKHTHTHTHTHTHAHTRTHVRTHTHACTHARTHACMHARTHTHTYARAHAQHTRTHARTHTHTHAHTRTHPTPTYPAKVICVVASSADMYRWLPFICISSGMAGIWTLDSVDTDPPHHRCNSRLVACTPRYLLVPVHWILFCWYQFTEYCSVSTSSLNAVDTSSLDTVGTSSVDTVLLVPVHWIMLVPVHWILFYWYQFTEHFSVGTCSLNFVYYRGPGSLLAPVHWILLVLCWHQFTE